jgi:hypothetical protein
MRVCLLNEQRHKQYSSKTYRIAIGTKSPCVPRIRTSDFEFMDLVQSCLRGGGGIWEDMQPSSFRQRTLLRIN